MKRKEAIKQIQEGKIQIENDLLPSTKQIKKFLKEAFPEDDYLEQNPKNTLIKYKYFFQHIKIKWFSCDFELNHIPTVKLSTITKNKKTKLSQLEKQFSELAKDVAELRQTLAKDVDVDVEEIDWSVPQLVIFNKGKVVATNGNHLKDVFEGIVVFSDISLHPVNYFSNNWNKRYFKPFKGELIIK